jgi:hypothetical protein
MGIVVQRHGAGSGWVKREGGKEVRRRGQLNQKKENRKKIRSWYSSKMFEYLFQDLMIRFEYQASFLNCRIG